MTIFSLFHDYIVTKLNQNTTVLAATSFLWYLIGNSLYYYNSCDFKIGRVLTSACHAITVVMFYLLNGPTWLLCSLSQGYYIMDTMYELVALKRAESIGLYQLGMILHHIVTGFGLTYLLNPLTTQYMLNAYFLAEVSNLPMYIVRILHYQNYENKNVIKAIIFLEFLAYMYFRMFLCGFIIYDVFTNMELPYVFKGMTLIMYTISAIWTYKLWTQVKRKN